MRAIRAAVAASALTAALILAPVAASGYSYSNTTIANMNTVSQTYGTRSGNIVGLWQNILYADTTMNKCGASGIDGYFGAASTAATKLWQRTYIGNGSADGIAGAKSWGAASKRVINLAYRPDGATNEYSYNGNRANVYLGRWHPNHSALNFRGQWTFTSESNPGNPNHILTTAAKPTFYAC